MNTVLNYDVMHDQLPYDIMHDQLGTAYPVVVCMLSAVLCLVLFIELVALATCGNYI